MSVYNLISFTGLLCLMTNAVTGVFVGRGSISVLGY